jgi:RNA 3'-terminal phosphate cyclase
MGSHLIDGEFQSDKYPTCPRGKVPLSVKDPSAQDLLWEYAQRRRFVDQEFADDLETALSLAKFNKYRVFNIRGELLKIIDLIDVQGGLQLSDVQDRLVRVLNNQTSY